MKMALTRQRPHSRRASAGAALRMPMSLQRLADRRHDVAHLVRIDGADAADAERFDLRQLARVQDIAARTHLVVEGLEFVGRIGRRVKGDDDRRLYAAGSR